jgi:D-3-phosphoglycerate dehydrogenase / 2-oxoglutarate reductase
MAKFKIVTPSADSFTVPGACYELEMEALQGLDADIVEVPAGPEDAFVAAARDADALYAKGMPITKRIIDGLGGAASLRSVPSGLTRLMSRRQRLAAFR